MWPLSVPAFSDQELQQFSTQRLYQMYRRVRFQAFWRIEGCVLLEEHSPEEIAYQAVAEAYRVRIKAVLDTREHLPRQARWTPPRPKKMGKGQQAARN